MSSGAAGDGSNTGGSSSHLFQNLSSLGLGYSIAIALGVLVLLSTLVLAAYLCCRSSSAYSRRYRNRYRNRYPNPNSHPSISAVAEPNGVVLPRIIFVSEDDDGEAQGHSPVPGLDQAAINSYPKFPFSKSKVAGGGGDTVCSICLCEYWEGEMLRMMPDCRHYFHLTCIDAWLRLNASCPVCRTSPMPTPMSTPLSELVPLSQYAADRRR